MKLKYLVPGRGVVETSMVNIAVNREELRHLFEELTELMLGRQMISMKSIRIGDSIIYIDIDEN